MKILFMGSARFACPAADALLNAPGVELVGAVTQPDRPSGRHLALTPCPVKKLLQERDVPVITPEKIGEPTAVEAVAAFKADLFVVAAYGQYIPSTVLALPRLGCINIHPSLLPLYRGAAPMQWAIANGDKETGITIQRVAKKMDAGDIVLQERHPIYDEDTGVTLEQRLSAASAPLLLRCVELIAQGQPVESPQDESKATYARKLTKEDGLLDWKLPALVLHNRIRGFQPWPGCHFMLEGRMVKVLKSSVQAEAGAPGKILHAGPDGLVVGTGAQALRLLEVQPEGKKPMPIEAFLCGHLYRSAIHAKALL